MYKIISAVFLLFLLTSCGSSGGGGGVAAGGGGGGGGAAPTVSGTVATGVALEGVVNVYGSNGGSVLDIPVDASGNYSADVTGLTAPFFLCAVPDNNALASQYSWAAGPGTVDITPMTTLTLFYANGDQDPASLVNTWQANQAAVSMNLPDSQAVVNANFVGIFSALNPLLNIDFSTYDFFTSGFNIGDVFDQILDLLGIDVTGGGAPSINVMGMPGFTFDPNIDTSGIDIGGPGGGSGGGGSGGSVAGVDPVTPLTSSETLTLPGVGQVTIESGFDSDIEFVNQMYQLATGIPSMNVVDVQRVVAVEISCTNGDNINGVITTDFSAGTVNVNGVINGQNVSCTSNFQPKFPPPVTIATTQDITDLLEDYGSDLLGDNAAQSGFTSTNCPSVVNDDINPFTTACDGSFLTNDTVTDDNTGIHNISTIFTFAAGSSGGGGGGGGGSSGLGSLTLSGVDTAAIGTSYDPTIQTGSAGTTTALVWIGGASGASLSVGASNGQLVSITYNDARVVGNQLILHSYALNCINIGVDCSNLQLNTATNEAVFSNLQLPLSAAMGNVAMGPVTFNGTLNWVD